MEMECKVVLGGLSDVEKLLTVLGDPMANDFQENHFLDSVDDCLARNKTVLRLRVVPQKAFCECTLKEDAVTQGGGTLRWATSATFPLDFCAAVLEYPDTLLTNDNPISSVLKGKYNIQSLHYVGGFRTNRRTYAHPGSEVQRHGLTLKVDQVEFPFQTQYEVEVAGVVVPLSDVLEELCEYLKRMGVRYVKSEGSKYEAFMEGRKQSMMSGNLRSSSVTVLTQ